MTFYVEGLRKSPEPEGQVRRIGEYRTLAEAIAAAQQTVDQFLWHAFEPGMDAKQLVHLYQAQGEVPFIFRDDDKTLNVRGFNHAQYAVTRAAEICSGKK